MSLRARVLCIWLPLALAGCRRSSDSSSPPDASKGPVDVASTIAGCQTLEECDQKCSSGQPAACVSAGRLYEYGRGVAADPARAYRLYDLSCALGYPGGCYNAAVLLESGRGVSKNVQRARQLYARVCQMGSNTAGERGGELSDVGGR
jgi:TPR repeat protein